MKKKIFTVFMALGLVMSINVTVMADTLDQLKKNRDEAQNQISQLLKDNDSKQKEVDKIDKNIQQLDSKIEGLMIKINQNKKDLDACQSNITTAEKEVANAESALQKQQDLLDKRIRTIYKNGSNGYVSIILQAKGFTDLVDRIEAVNKMVAFDNNVISEMDDKRIELKQKKQALDDEKARIQKIKSENEAEKTSLNNTKKEQKALRDKNKQDITKFTNKITDLNKLIINLDTQIDEKNNQQQIPSRGDISYSSNDVVRYAMEFLGTPYHWGGNGPKTFDCSGFVRFVYAHFGVDLPRTTDGQNKVGQSVSRDDIQPGDLILFGDNGDPHHVGLYVGNNCYIHAPQTGDVVKISPLTRTDIVSIRRVR